MLVIRLSRTGRNKYPTYRIVAAEQARAATGKFITILGHYNPHTKELVIKKDEVSRYLTNGAQPSNTVIKLLQKEQIELPKWASIKTKQRAPKKTPAPVAAAPVASEAVAEATEAEAAPESVVETAEINAEAMAAADRPADQAETAEDVETETKAAEKASDVAAEAAADQPAAQTDAAKSDQ